MKLPVYGEISIWSILNLNRSPSNAKNTRILLFLYIVQNPFLIDKAFINASSLLWQHNLKRI
jgi:hypothetical protein